MSSMALKSPSELLSPGESFSLKQNIGKHFIFNGDEFKKQSERLVSLSRLNEKPISRSQLIGLISVVLVAHVFGVHGFVKALSEPSIVKNEKKEVIIEFIKPVVIPPQEIEPPKPPPPPPPQVKRVTPPPAATPAPATLKTAPAVDNIAPTDITVKENTEAVKSTGPVVAEPAPPPPAPKVEEPVTEAKGHAGYLKNPAPEYPAFAQRQGWEGNVILRVRVLASGQASDIQIKKSSGRSVLDEAAKEAVSGWVFAPAKRGDKPIDGWATVPIEFRLAK